ncbi:MAG: polysaccharide biosynthesis protein [Bacteroidaceae bacterium]|nr:polysaccharide biosynthesis protein [Bacteroidaceae bacterium]
MKPNGPILKIFDKLTFNHYTNVYIILFIDLCMGFAGTLLTFFTTDVICRNVYGFKLAQACQDTIVLWYLSGMTSMLVSMLLLKTYRASIRYTTLRDTAKYTLSVFLKLLSSFIFVHTLAFPTYFENFSMSVLAIWCMLDFVFSVSLLILVRTSLISCYELMKKTRQFLLHKSDSRKRILIYGTDTWAISAADVLEESEDYNLMGFIVPQSKSSVKSKILRGKRVYIYRNIADISKLKNDFGIQVVYFPSNINQDHLGSKLAEHLISNHMTALVSKGIENAFTDNMFKMRQINVDDLLEREKITISRTDICNFFKGRTVMVTGAAGSIGSEICRQLAFSGVKSLILYDNAETPMHNLRLELDSDCPNLEYVPIIGDVRQINRLDYTFRTFRPDIVFHAAAYKHVPLMEENPTEAIQVNVLGTRNVADKCVEYGVRKMVMISTDKAVNPTNIMGCSKRLAEIYVQSLGQAIEKGRIKGSTKFVTTRFGNVLGSNGSVIPRFKDQIAKGGPVTVTHPEITRFFMTIPEACCLVLEAIVLQTDNKICVFDMGRPVKIAHLAERMIRLAGFVPGKDISIVYTGLRPGEKLYEEVLANNENTVPTDNKRIMIACVREYDYEHAKNVLEKIDRLAKNPDVSDMVKYMKEVVPEFKSENSEFCQFDI